MSIKVKTPEYWKKKIYQPLIEVETAYGNKVMIPKQFSGGWKMAKLQMEFIKKQEQDPLDILKVGQDSNPDKEINPLYFDLEQVFYEIFEKEQ